MAGVLNGFESRRSRSLFAVLQVTSTLARGDCHERAERLMLRSGPPGVGEYERDPPKMSTSCSWRTTEYLGSRRNLGTESWESKLACNNGILELELKVPEWTYTRHQLEDRGLGKLEQVHHLLQTLEHRLVVTHGLGHTAGETVAQGVVDVQFTGGPGS